MMRTLAIERQAGRPLRVLCIGCHSDDIEIGCGGAVLRIGEEYAPCAFHWAVIGACAPRDAEARRAASCFAGPQLAGALIQGFRDGYMPWEAARIKEFFEAELKPLDPDLIFTHQRGDAHQDHRTISELTWNTFRDHLILEYEIPKYDGDMGRPNLFLPLGRESCMRKVDLLLECFASQRSKRWFEESTFLGLMRLRGMESNAPSGYAEAFYCHKLLL